MLKKISIFATGTVKVLCVVLFLAMMLSLTLMIISRNVSFINFDVMWTDEVGRYMLVYLVFLGGGLAMIEGKHIRVNFLLDKMSDKLRKYIEIFNEIATIAFCAVMVGGGFVLVQSTGTQAVSTLRKFFKMPMSIWNSAIMISGAIMLLAALVKLVRIIKHKQSHAEMTPFDEKKVG